MIKHLPTMRETQVRSLRWEDPLEKKMATHSSTLAWKIPWTEDRGRLQSMESQSWTGLSDFTSTLRCFSHWHSAVSMPLWTLTLRRLWIVLVYACLLHSEFWLGRGCLLCFRPTHPSHSFSNSAVASRSSKVGLSPTSQQSRNFTLFFLFLYFSAALGLHCCAQAFLWLWRAGATL